MSAIFKKLEHRIPENVIFKAHKRKAGKTWEGRLSEEKLRRQQTNVHTHSLCSGEKKGNTKHQKVACELLSYPLSSVVCFG